MNVKQKKYGFTIVELLTVLAIIALLTGILIPSLNLVRNIARETKQKAQFATIDQALMAFRSDYGDYPRSDGFPPSSGNTTYCGAQKLAEALLGQDLLGFHPGSYWLADGSGVDKYGSSIICYPPNPSVDNLNDRADRYLDPSAANAFRPIDLFNNIGPFLNGDRFVLCDSFGVRKLTLTGPTGKTVTVKAGTPILYYRANTSSKYQLTAAPTLNDEIYDRRDNVVLTDLGRLTSNGATGKIHDKFIGDVFYDYITDLKIFNSTGIRWPYRADSYILISAGADGLYGTRDDITNFGN